MLQQMMEPRPDVRALIAAEAVETHLQPIASMRRQGLIGVEALTRCVVDGASVPPTALFAAAREDGLAAELDRLCRRRALECFRDLHLRYPELVLFVNCHTSTLSDSLDAPDGWAELAQRLGIDPRNIAVEISEEEIDDLAAARAASRILRERGFLVVLDDVGVRSANLDRVAELQPDIIKADRVLVSGVHGDFHRREVLRSLVVLSERLGGWVIAEGVETADDALTVAELGGDMLQGYLLGRPRLAEPLGEVSWNQPEVVDLARRYREQRVLAGRTARSRREERSRLIRSIADGLIGVEGALEPVLGGLIAPHPSILSAAVLDEHGIQITHSVLNPIRVLRQKTVIFAPTALGSDHSLKEYYYLLVEGEADPFESPPYTPLATGALAITIATRCGDPARGRILALHMSADAADHAV